MLQKLIQAALMSNRAPYTSESVIWMQDLCKSYSLGGEQVPVLNGINFIVARGEYISIMGQSGAGKSTLLNILGCLDNFDNGTYKLNGKDVSKFSEASMADLRNHEIGFVFQNFNLLPRLSVEANVELPLIYAGVTKCERQTRVEAMLKRFGIWDRRHHRPSEISGGQKQRAAIARALIKNPALILADEPTGNLDSKTSAEILAIFHEISTEGNTIVMITHEHDVAAHAQRIVTIADGRVLL